MADDTSQNSAHIVVAPIVIAPIVIAITGASGFQYGLRLLQCLVAARQTCYVVVSRAALKVAEV